MNQIGQTFLIFVTGLAGGIVGSMILSSGSAPMDSSFTDGGTTILTTDTKLAALIDGMQGEIVLLSEEISQHKSTIQSLDSRLANMQTLRGDGLVGGQELDPLLGLDPSEIPSGQGFDAAVNAAIEKREADAAAEREVARVERRAEQIDRQMENYIKELGLDSAQANQMKTILLDASTARETLFAEMRESGSFDRQTMRDSMMELNESTNTQLGNVLNTTQMNQYTEMSSNRFGGGFGGGNNGGGRGTSGRNTGGGRTNEF